MADFNELTNRISGKLSGIVRRLDVRKSYFDYDDLYQEAMCSLWVKWNAGELADKTDSYILQGCMFHLKNYIRCAYKKMDTLTVRASASNTIDGETSAEEFITVHSEDKNFAFFMVDLKIEEIERYLEGRELEVFRLSLEEMTTREIGSRIGVSHAMVVKIEKRIRSKCSELLSYKVTEENKLP